MSKVMQIGQRLVGEGHPCFIIAEAGVNHNGRLDLAKQLIDVAACAGVDAVKFQTFKTGHVIIDGIEKASYQKQTTSPAESQTAMLKNLEMDKAFHLELVAHCKARSILFLSTCSDEESLTLLMALNLPALKIASMDTANPMFLEHVGRTGKPVILSTGMSSQDEIEQACQTLRKNGCKELALLKCTSNYPTSIVDVHLKAMFTLKEQFDVVVGFSDHTEGLGASPYAVAMGASIVEKHFTVDKTLPGPDHQASLSPEELTAWVKEVRKVEQMLGSPVLQPTKGEEETRKALRRSLVAKGHLRTGDVITRANIAAKRTGGKGMPSGEFYNVLGLKLTRDLSADQPINRSDLGK